MLLATSGHIPLSPAKVVKANTLQEGRSLLSSNPKDRKRKSSTAKRYWVIHTLHRRATHFSHDRLCRQGEPNLAADMKEEVELEPLTRCHQHRRLC